MAFNVIGLCGYPGAGKTEVRNILQRDFQFEVINSKSMIYHLASQVTGLPEANFYRPDLKDEKFKGVNHRVIAGELGAAIEQLFGEDYLIQEALKNHRVASRPTKPFVVDSLRRSQPQLLSTQMRVIEVQSDRALYTGNFYDNYELGGVSSILIPNDGTIADLEKKVHNTVRTLGLDTLRG
jgi:hypothetical protein